MSKIPLEIQQEIYDRVPEYTRVSKNRYVGKNVFKNQCSSPITKSELIKYLKQFKVDHFIIYSYNALDTEFVIDLFELRPETKWNPMNFSFYKQTSNIIQLGEVSPGILKFQYVSLVVNNYMPFNEIPDYDDFYLDIITTFNIVKNMRKECENIKLQLNKNYIRHSINQVLKKLPIGKTNYDVIFSELVKLIYV